jgi:hypothetical protein
MAASSKQSGLTKTVKAQAGGVSGLFTENQMIDQLYVDGLGGLTQATCYGYIC